jgi:hypothetical protein
MPIPALPYRPGTSIGAQFVGPDATQVLDPRCLIEPMHDE